MEEVFLKKEENEDNKSESMADGFGYLKFNNDAYSTSNCFSRLFFHWSFKALKVKFLV